MDDTVAPDPVQESPRRQMARVSRRCSRLRVRRYLYLAFTLWLLSRLRIKPDPAPNFKISGRHEVDTSRLEVVVSYCPHSGYSNQLKSLLSAVQIASRIQGRVHLFIPPVLSLKTTGLTGSNSSCISEHWLPWCDSCLKSPFRAMDSVPWSQLIDLDALKTPNLSVSEVPVGTSIEAHYHNIFGSRKTQRVADLCHIAGKCDSRIVSSLSIRSLLLRLQCSRIPIRSSGRKIEVHVGCLHRLATKEEQQVLWLRFGSMLNLSDGEKKPIIDQRIRFIKRIHQAAYAFIHQNFSAQQGQFWCAHLRTGYSEWDRPPTGASMRFQSEWRSLKMEKFRIWLKNVSHMHGVLFTDNITEVKLYAMCGLASIPHIPESSISFTGLSQLQIMAAKQLICSAAQELFTTERSTFSEVIRALKAFGQDVHQSYK